MIGSFLAWVSLRSVLCDQIGRFLEFLGNEFITKVTQMFSDFMGSCENNCFYVKLVGLRFGQLFISTSRHTGSV